MQRQPNMRVSTSCCFARTCAMDDRYSASHVAMTVTNSGQIQNHSWCRPPKATSAIHEEYGVEDPRICFIGDEYYITYSAYSRFGVRIGLAKTRDFKTVERVSLISQADMRNVVIFPDTFNGRYARLDRPHSEINPWCIWLSWSPDLVHWGESVPVIQPVQYHWDEMKIGPGATPIKTGRGMAQHLPRRISDHGWCRVSPGCGAA